MPKEHLSNVTEPWGRAGLQEDALTRQTRFYLLLMGSACGVFGASSSALPWRGSAGYWGAISPCLRNQGSWNSAPGHGWLVWWGSEPGLVLEEQDGGLWLQQLSPVLVPVLCSVLAQSWGF